MLNRLGVLSYSMYVWHVPLFTYGLVAALRFWPAPLGWNARTTVVALFLCALCLGLSELTYRFIERPFLIRKQRHGA